MQYEYESGTNLAQFCKYLVGDMVSSTPMMAARC